MKYNYNYYFTPEDIDDWGEDVIDNCNPVGSTVSDDNGNIIKVDNLKPSDPGFEETLRNLSRFPSMTLIS